MLRRRSPSPPIGSNFPGLAFPKGPTRRQEKDARDRQQAAVVGHVRHAVWQRSAGRCEVCGDTERDTLRRHGHEAHLPHQMHELESRAATRGREADARFNTANCIRACAPCHRDLTEHRARLVVGERGADGYIEVIR